MSGLINFENLQVDVHTKDTSSTARTKSKDHVLEDDQTVVKTKPTRKKCGVRHTIKHFLF